MSGSNPGNSSPTLTGILGEFPGSAEWSFPDPGFDVSAADHLEFGRTSPCTALGVNTRPTLTSTATGAAPRGLAVTSGLGATAARGTFAPAVLAASKSACDQALAAHTAYLASLDAPTRSSALARTPQPTWTQTLETAADGGFKWVLTLQAGPSFATAAAAPPSTGTNKKRSRPLPKKAATPPPLSPPLSPPPPLLPVPPPPPPLPPLPTVTCFIRDCSGSLEHEGSYGYCKSHRPFDVISTASASALYELHRVATTLLSRASIPYTALGPTLEGALIFGGVHPAALHGELGISSFDSNAQFIHNKALEDLPPHYYVDVERSGGVVRALVFRMAIPEQPGLTGTECVRLRHVEIDHRAMRASVGPRKFGNFLLNALRELTAASEWTPAYQAHCAHMTTRCVSPAHAAPQATLAPQFKSTFMQPAVAVAVAGVHTIGFTDVTWATHLSRHVASCEVLPALPNFCAVKDKATRQLYATRYFPVLAASNPLYGDSFYRMLRACSNHLTVHIRPTPDAAVLAFAHINLVNASAYADAPNKFDDPHFSALHVLLDTHHDPLHPLYALVVSSAVVIEGEAVSAEHLHAALLGISRQVLNFIPRRTRLVVVTGSEHVASVLGHAERFVSSGRVAFQLSNVDSLGGEAPSFCVTPLAPARLGDPEPFTVGGRLLAAFTRSRAHEQPSLGLRLVFWDALLFAAGQTAEIGTFIAERTRTQLAPFNLSPDAVEAELEMYAAHAPTAFTYASSEYLLRGIDPPTAAQSKQDIKRRRKGLQSEGVTLFAPWTHSFPVRHDIVMFSPHPASSSPLATRPATLPGALEPFSTFDASAGFGEPSFFDADAVSVGSIGAGFAV